MKHVGPLSVAAPQIEASPHRAAWVPAVVGINRFGLSAPGGTVMKELGITAEHVVEVARKLKVS